MDGKIIAVVCVVLIVGLGAGTLIGINLGQSIIKNNVEKSFNIFS